MGKILRRNSDERQTVTRRVRRLETRSPLGNTSVTDGQTEFNGEESVAINGSGRVAGVFYVDGRIVIAGTFDLDGIGMVTGHFTVAGPSTFIGSVRIEGPQEYVGDSTREGDQVVTGKTDHEGDIDLTGDMTVRGGGRVTIDGTTDVVLGKLDNGHAGIDFGNAEMYSDGEYLAQTAGESTVGVTATFAQVSHAGNGFRATASGPELGGVIRATEGQTLYSVLMDGDGKLYRSREAFTPTEPGGGTGPVEV